MKKTIFTSMAIAFLSTLFLFSQPVAHAGLFDAAKNEACGGAQLQNGAANCGAANTSQLDSTIAEIINLISIIVGIVAVIMIIVYGLKFITSGGDANKVGSAKNGILFAVVGLVIVALAQFIVKFVINKV